VRFPVFHVERILAGAELGSAEERDRALDELRPVLVDLPPSVLREDLLRRVAGRLELSEERLGALLASGPAAGPSPSESARAPAARRVVADRGAHSEASFLALCIALPEAGHRVLSEVDVEKLLTSDAMRGAARHLETHADAPLSDLPADDEQLPRVIAELVARAGRMPDVSEARLDHARLVLERDRLDRAIRRARVQGQSEVGALAREREEVLEQIHRVVGRLEEVV
jgi:DNA primase